MNGRWKVWSLNYVPTDATCSRRRPLNISSRPWADEPPWLAGSSYATFRLFTTHAEAIAYADKQARRDNPGMRFTTGDGAPLSGTLTITGVTPAQTIVRHLDEDGRMAPIFIDEDGRMHDTEETA